MKSVNFCKVSLNNLNVLNLNSYKGFSEQVEHSQKIFRIIKNPNIFLTRWKTPAVTSINYIRENLEIFHSKIIWEGIHFLYARKFCRRPTSEVSASEQSLCSASIERAVLVYIRSV